MSCRDHARVGQLLLNKGHWPGQSKPLINPALVEQILLPHFPNVSKSYGLLTWLGGATADPGNCALRFHSNSFPSCSFVHV